MKSICLLIPIALTLASCGPSKPAANEPRYPAEPPASFPLVTGEAGPDDVGRFLAGKPVRRGALLSRLQQSLEYQAHQVEINRVWRTTGRFRANRMEEWANAQVTPAIGSGGAINYPFGGPDLLHVSAMFPQAKTYVLMGLESVGEVPPLESMPAGEVLAVLDSFRQSIKTQLLAGYFITKDMRSDLERSSLRGVTPILLSTIAMLGGEVESVRSISAGGNPGVEVQYYDSAGMRHTACYAAGDLSNSGFKGGYQQWVAGFGGKATYFKAASYLMHDDRFSNARNFFLSSSRAVLQDDSGIPFRYFGEAWNIRYFGSYESPIELFAKHQQNDLKQAYASNPASPLAFGSGYHVNYSDANLILALKR
ncbi:MAG: hypothetical protein MUF13_12485 [Akkermansiaceae bacterium]|nr:hypothetical protein [Akkermansiaceae bacterium]